MTSSTIILTHSRSAMLEKCLNSLMGQLTPDDNIILINNNSNTAETAKVENLIRPYRRTKIHYFFNPSSLIPKGRNLGLDLVKRKAEIINFVDDDCIVAPNWLINTKNQHSRHPGWGAIQGRVISLPLNSFYAQLTSSNYQNWLRSNFLTTKTLFTFDSKNLSLKVQSIKTLRFNEHLIHSSDIDLGQKFTANGLIIGYSPEVLVYHQERTTLDSFLKQHLQIAGGESMLRIKLFPNRYYYHLSSSTRLLVNLLRKREISNVLKFTLLVPTIISLRVFVFFLKRLSTWRNRQGEREFSKSSYQYS